MRAQARPASTARAAPAPDPAAPDSEQYAFLRGALIDAGTLERACRLAAQWNVTPHEVMLANGWVRPHDYFRALARDCGTEFVEPESAHALAPLSPEKSPRQALRGQVLRRVRGGDTGVALSPLGARPHQLKQRLANRPGGAAPVSIATPRDLRETVARTLAEGLTARAVHGLARRYPGESAAGGLSAAQKLALAGTFAGLCLSGALAPILTLRVLAATATLFFALVVGLRLAACINLVPALPVPWRRRPAPRTDDAALPVYTILVPLYRERAVLPGLAAALSRLDYPAAKLDLKLIFEANDPETLAAAKVLDLPGNAEFIVVPAAGPRTKPKALNYALQFARGEYAVIFDAEDRPEPDQLRKALAAFRAGPPDLACVQARLAFYNAGENWLTRGIR